MQATLPLIALATVGQLDMLGSLYGSVLIPGAVFREVTEAGGGRSGALEVASATWIERVDVDPPPDRLLATELSFLGNSIFGIFGSRDRPSHPCVAPSCLRPEAADRTRNAARRRS